MSNFPDKPNGGDPDAGAAVSYPAPARLAREHEIQNALQLILGTGAKPAESEEVREFLDYAAMRQIDVRRTWVAERAGRLLWAVLPIPSPGKTALFFASPAPSRFEAEAGLLIEAVSGYCRASGVQLAQALLEAGDEFTLQTYLNHGFRRMAELVYLHAAVRRKAPAPAIKPPLYLLNYSEPTHELFAAAISESYRESLDCPGLNGVRHIEDVIVGHKASGEFDPRCWFVLCEQDAGREMRPLGALLLSRLPRGDAAELVYLGLAPHARGRGLGGLLMKQALHTVSALGVPRLSLAVDSINLPALKLYHRHGLQEVGSKIAVMRELVGEEEDRR